MRTGSGARPASSERDDKRRQVINSLTKHAVVLYPYGQNRGLPTQSADVELMQEEPLDQCGTSLHRRLTQRLKLLRTLALTLTSDARMSTEQFRGYNIRRIAQAGRAKKLAKHLPILDSFCTAVHRIARI